MKAKNALRLAILLVVLGVMVTGWYFDVHTRVDIDAVRAWLVELGPLGGLGFVVTVALVQPLHISIHAFLLAAAAVWDPLEAMVWSWLGCMACALTSFFFGRFMAREWVQENLPEKFRRYEDRLERHTFKTVLVLRLLFFTTPMLQFFYGAVRLRFWPWLAATAIGFVPTVVVVVLLSDQVIAWMEL